MLLLLVIQISGITPQTDSNTRAKTGGEKKGTSMLSVCISGQANEAENVKVTGNDGQVQRLLRPVGQ